MKREEAYRLAMRACEETWNEKTCKQIKEALEQEPCEDAISRKAALDCLNGKIKMSPDMVETFREYLQGVIDAIEVLASVMPQRTGHWIECEDEVKCFCSECKEISDYPTKFCPNCGAKMIEPQEESEEQA